MNPYNNNTKTNPYVTNFQKVIWKNFKRRPTKK